jgi:CHAT domain-containing protein
VESNFPAEKAGLVLGDEILEINGERIDLRENAETFYLSKIRGKVGTVVNLKLKRNVTNEIFEVSLKRELPYVASPIVNWNYLKGTKIEIQEISKIIQPKSKKITIYSGENASEENLKKIENPSVLHIATHSFYIDREKNSNNIFAGVLTQDYKYSVFLLNGLVMSGVNDLYFPEMSLNKENGFLNGLELSLLNIKNTDLVVISGCESGQGVHGIGEGISGLKEALFRAGAKNLILAKYPISDRATQDFFTEFYSRLSSVGSIDEVLRATKIEMNKKYKHPYYWSAFQLHIR